MAPLIQVFDMPTSLAFYRDKLGFEVMQTSGQGDQSGWVMLKLNDAVLMLNTMYEGDYRPTNPDPVRGNNHSDTALYFGCPDVNDAYDYFLSKGLEVKKPYITGYGYKEVDLIDPDGYHLCFHWPAE
jgi:catechol 2,3-dioxygenase-like lactoylglutathione lyase family enzyme